MRVSWRMCVLSVLGTVQLALGQAPPAAAPTKPVLENTGKPMKVGFSCTSDEVGELGLSCSVNDPCPMFLELSTLASVGNRLLLAGNIHTNNITWQSILLASEDQGKTWQEPYERMKSATLDHIQFIDFANGWISGQGLFPTPHDPFLMITSNGGKTWRMQLILEDNAPGMVEQFAFSTRSDGTLVLDRRAGAEGGRYALYETKTGGESWMLREINEKPMKLKLPVPAGEGWRLRADTRSKSYQVETNGDKGWQPVASFLVKLGDCTGEPPAEKAPEKPEGTAPK